MIEAHQKSHADGQDAPAEPMAESLANNASLLEALNAMADGFALYDADDRLLASNRRFREFFGQAADKIVHGVPFAELVRHKWAGGLFGSSLESGEDFIRWRIAVHLQPGESHTLHLTDGRWLQLNERRTSDGGIVSIYADITGLKARERELTGLTDSLSAKNVHFDAALNNMVQGLCMFDANQRLIVCNQRYLEMYGFSPEVVKPGISLQEIMEYSVALGNYSRGDAERAVSERPAQAAAREETRLRQRLSDGRVIAVAHRPMADGGSVATYEDITESVRREDELAALSDELKARNLHFDTALNNMTQGLCMFDADQRMIVHNDRYMEMYNFSPDHVKPGMSLREIMEYSVSIGSYDNDDGTRAVVERPMHANMRKRITLHQRLADGRVIAVMHEPMSDGGSVATYEDITERVRTEEQLRDYASKLEGSNQELQNFAFIASHDLQEPLRKIETFAGRLSKKYGEAIGDDGALYLDRMLDASGRMRVLIQDLLSYSRITTRAKPFEQVDLSAVAKDAVSDLAVRIEETGGKVEVGELPVLTADATQMRQLLQNLISNALKFHKPDVPPVIEVSAQMVPTSTVEDGVFRTAGEIIEIRVKDNGIGFDPKYTDKIFAVFQRLHGRGEYEGTGIGLATCRKIAERHHGTIEAEGQPDVGATFVVRLPVTQKGTEEDNGEND